MDPRTTMRRRAPMKGARRRFSRIRPSASDVVRDVSSFLLRVRRMRRFRRRRVSACGNGVRGRARRSNRRCGSNRWIGRCRRIVGRCSGLGRGRRHVGRWSGGGGLRRRGSRSARGIANDGARAFAKSVGVFGTVARQDGDADGRADRDEPYARERAENELTECPRGRCPCRTRRHREHAARTRIMDERRRDL